MSTAWFRRGDGAEFAVPEDSEAYAALVGQGAVRFEPKGKGKAAAPEPEVVTAAPESEGEDKP